MSSMGFLFHDPLPVARPSSLCILKQNPNTEPQLQLSCNFLSGNLHTLLYHKTPKSSPRREVKLWLIFPLGKQSLQKAVTFPLRQKDETSSSPGPGQVGSQSPLQQPCPQLTHPLRFPRADSAKPVYKPRRMGIEDGNGSSG